MAKNKNALVPRKRLVERKESNGTKMNIIVSRYRHSGPIPDPITLKGYENICPGAADRIITMAENQAKHRQEIGKISIRSRTGDSKMGIIFGFILALATIISGTVTIWHGHVWSGAILGSAGPVGIVSAFIYGTRSNRKEREQEEDST